MLNRSSSRSVSLDEKLKASSMKSGGRRKFFPSLVPGVSIIIRNSHHLSCYRFLTVNKSPIIISRRCLNNYPLPVIIGIVCSPRFSPLPVISIFCSRRFDNRPNIISNRPSISSRSCCVDLLSLKN